ncbi:hypothetical protein A2U01_0117690, partial [Trifolium medium]|nr:hypothetical protein [Trifolium medium]
MSGLRVLEHLVEPSDVNGLKLEMLIAVANESNT